MKVSSSFGIKPFSSYRVCVCVQARVLLLVYALGVKDRFWHGRSRKTQVWCFNKAREGKCATNSLLWNNNLWGTLRREVLCSCLHSERDLVCFAFPSRRWGVMTLQVQVKKTCSHGCLWLSQASRHHAQEGIFPFACRWGFPGWNHHTCSMADQSITEGLPGSPGCWMFTEGPISRALQGLQPGWARLCSQRWCVWLQPSCEPWGIMTFFSFLHY